MERLLRRPEVQRQTGLGRAQIYALMDRGQFPKPVNISRRAVAWKLSSIEKWVEERCADPNGRAFR